MNNETAFRLQNLKMKNTRDGVSWKAKILFNGDVVGDVFDDGANMFPSYNFKDLETEVNFQEWSKQFGMEDFQDIDLVASGLYALSEIYAEEVEGVKL
jgi:hypothetical protein